MRPWFEGILTGHGRRRETWAELAIEILLFLVVIGAVIYAWDW